MPFHFHMVIFMPKEEMPCVYPPNELGVAAQVWLRPFPAALCGSRDLERSGKSSFLVKATGTATVYRKSLLRLSSSENGDQSCGEKSGKQNQIKAIQPTAAHHVTHTSAEIEHRIQTAPKTKAVVGVGWVCGDGEGHTWSHFWLTKLGRDPSS